jgi:hypothetical protein
MTIVKFENLRMNAIYLAYFPSLRRVLYGRITRWSETEEQYVFKEIVGFSNNNWADHPVTWNIDGDDYFWDLDDEELTSNLICTII